MDSHSSESGGGRSKAGFLSACGGGSEGDGRDGGFGVCGEAITGALLTGGGADAWYASSWSETDCKVWVRILHGNNCQQTHRTLY